MNEEEKKVVELLEHCQNTYIEDTLVTRLQLTTEEAKILLNLIKKQQKEIEELKKEKRILIEKYTDVVYECGKRNEKIEYLQKRLYRKGVFSKEKFVWFYPKQYQDEYVKIWVNESDGLTPKEMEELGYGVMEECLI